MDWYDSLFEQIETSKIPDFLEALSAAINE
jgi:hypothetical protein